MPVLTQGRHRRRAAESRPTGRTQCGGRPETLWLSRYVHLWRERDPFALHPIQYTLMESRVAGTQVRQATPIRLVHRHQYELVVQQYGLKD